MIWRKLRGLKATYDPLVGSAELRAAKRAFGNGDWLLAQELMQTDGDRSLTVAGLTSGGILPMQFEQYAKAKPGSSAHTLLAVRLTKAAWAIRGRGYADTVSEQSFLRFHDKLLEAQEAAVNGIKLGPPSADAHAAMMVIARGLQSGMDEMETQFEAAHELVPFHDAATAAMFQARCNKWYGTHEAMFSFARWVASEAPPGASVQWIMPQAHFERWAAMHETGVARPHYFSQPDTQNEIAAAARRFLDATPSGPAAPELLLALNWFAIALASAKKRDKSMLAECVDRIDGRVTEFPWVHLSEDPARGYQIIVRRAL